MLVKFHNFIKTNQDYIFINSHGKMTSSTTGHLIVYGVNGYDSPYFVENGKMVMETDLDVNGYKLKMLHLTVLNQILLLLKII